MAILRQEFNWSTYQERQLEVLHNIQEATKISSENTREVSRALEKTVNHLDKLVNLTLVAASKEFNTSMEELSQQADELCSEFRVTHRTSMSINRENERLETTTRSLRDRMESLANDTFVEFRQSMERLSRYIDQVTERYIDTSNKMIQITGASGDTVRDFRGSFVDEVVSRLNDDTENYYDPTSAYNQVAAMAQSASIGNLDALKEISRPALLAQESMDIHIGEMAKLFNKWYTRYDFHSSDMEIMVDSIKYNTAGNSASAEATMRNLSLLEGTIAREGKYNKETMVMISKSIASSTAWLESMNVDTSRYTGYIKDIMSDAAKSDTKILTLLSRSGLSVDEAQGLVRTGDIQKVYEALLKGEASIYRDIENGGATAQAAEAFGMTYDDLLEAINATDNPKFTTYRDFLDLQQENNPFGEEGAASRAVDDKSQDLATQLQNIAKEYIEPISSILERMEIKLGTIATVLIAAKGLSMYFRGGNSGVGGSIGRSILDSIRGGGGRSLGDLFSRSFLSSFLRGLPSLGSLFTKLLGPIGLAITGVTTAVSLVNGAINALEETTKEIAKEEEKTTDDIIEAIQNPDKKMMMQEKVKINKDGSIEKSYEYGLVDKSKYNKEEDLKMMEEARSSALKDHQWDYTKQDQSIRAALGLGRDRGNGLFDVYNVPILGSILQSVEDARYKDSINDTYNRQKIFTDWVDGLSSQERLVAQLYAEKKLITSRDQLEYLMSHIDELTDLYTDEGSIRELKAGGTTIKADVPGYETGTNYVPQNQLAFLHEGEAVIPKKYNPSAFSPSYLEELKSNNATAIETLNSVVTVLTEIKQFLEANKADSERKSIAKSHFERFGLFSNATSRYLTGGV